MNETIFAAASRYLGLEEWPGSASNPEVERLFAAAGFPGLKDEVPWCAAFVGAVLAECGIPASGSLMARSYLKWGQKVELADARPGDVVVFPRGTPPAGHVGFFAGWQGDKVIIRGGNQGNKVKDALFPASTILAVRRADPSTPSGRATVRQGDKGAMVLDLQDQLARLGYFSGKKDGDFGPLTRGSVLAFQADHGLETDGIVGNRTWAAMAKAKPRAERKATTADMRAKGSETIASADKAQAGLVVAAATGAVGKIVDDFTADPVGTISDVASRGWPIKAWLADNWWLIAAAVVLVYALVYMQRVKERRVADHASGANRGR